MNGHDGVQPSFHHHNPQRHHQHQQQQQQQQQQQDQWQQQNQHRHHQQHQNHQHQNHQQRYQQQKQQQQQLQQQQEHWRGQQQQQQHHQQQQKEHWQQQQRQLHQQQQQQEHWRGQQQHQQQQQQHHNQQQQQEHWQQQQRQLHQQHQQQQSWHQQQQQQQQCMPSTLLCIEKLEGQQTACTPGVPTPGTADVTTGVTDVSTGATDVRTDFTAATVAHIPAVTTFTLAVTACTSNAPSCGYCEAAYTANLTAKPSGLPAGLHSLSAAPAAPKCADVSACGGVATLACETTAFQQKTVWKKMSSVELRDCRLQHMSHSQQFSKRYQPEQQLRKTVSAEAAGPMRDDEASSKSFESSSSRSCTHSNSGDAKEPVTCHDGMLSVTRNDFANDLTYDRIVRRNSATSSGGSMSSLSCSVAGSSPYVENVDVGAQVEASVADLSLNELYLAREDISMYQVTAQDFVNP
ncbi:unnamed protein product [Closterium sp. NIES-54]